MISSVRFASCAVAVLGATVSACAVESQAPGGGALPPCVGKCDHAQSTPRAALLDRLRAVMDSGRFLFGQQRFNLTGVEQDGTQWLATDQLDRSDVATLVGSHPAVLGVDAWDLAIKPASWSPSPELHGRALRAVADAGGVVTVEWHMRGCNSDELSGGFLAAGNEDCLCRLANDDAFATEWLDHGKLDRLADALEGYGLADTPIVFRPFHEMTGGWFWWGYPYWDCENRVAGATVTGPEAYRAVFRRVVDYLRSERGLDQLVIAYAPDKLWEGVGATEEARYLAGYPGDDYVDVLGIDLYYLRDRDFAEQTARYAGYLRLVTRLARERNKIAALTETGNYELADEATPADSRWFSDHLLPLLADDPEVAMAFVLTWENRKNGPTEFYVPFPGHAGVDDFRAFAAHDATLLLDDVAGGGAPPYATCSGCAPEIDPDGDGWGWENEQSCVVSPSCS